MFLNQRQIENSLNALELIHPFFGISFLVFKQADLPIGKAITFPLNRKEESFLQQYYRPDSRSDWFYRVFRVSDKKKYWLRPDYVWKGSQVVRTQTVGQAFIHETGTDEWGWHKDYIEVLKELLRQGQPLPAFALAVWLYRDQDWPKDTTPQDIVDEFLSQFKINSSEKAELFDISVPEIPISEAWLVERPSSWTELSESLHIPPPPVIQDEGGTLSALMIKGVGPARKLELELTERINLFTGDNGLGKSFLLESAWWALSGQWTSFPAYPREDAKRNEPKISFQILSSAGKRNTGESSYNWELHEWASPGERPTVPGLLIYARVDGAFAVWDPVRDYWASTGKKASSKPLVFTREEVWNGLQDSVDGKTVFVSNGLIADWIHWQNSPEKEPFEILKQVLQRLSPPDLESGDLGRLEPGTLTRIPRDSRWMPTIKHSYGDIPLVHASAGVRRIVALAYLIVWAWEEHKTQSKLMRKNPQKRMVILVDEIEAHLHPKWQRRILPALLNVRKDLDSELRVQFLIATHSPLVMASVEPVFDAQKDRIFHLDLAKRDLFETEVKLQELEFFIHGTVDSWLKSEIFELSQARSEEAEKAIKDAKKLQMRADVTKDKVEEVSQRLVKYLAAHDIFWPRWTFFAQEHGVEL